MWSDGFSELVSSHNAALNFELFLFNDTGQESNTFGGVDVISCDHSDVDLVVVRGVCHSFGVTVSDKLNSLLNVINDFIFKTKGGKVCEIALKLVSELLGL